MATRETPFPNPLSMVTSATQENAEFPGKLKLGNFLPDSVDTDIAYNRWDKLFPYALIIAQSLPNSKLPGAVKTGSTYQQVARFVLPIPPEQLTIQTPYAIQVSKTLTGIVEEHNADPFRMIAFTGTTGTNPLRANSRTATNNNIFGGIVEASQQTATAFTGPTIAVDEPTNFTDQQKGTGYGQFRLLELFLQSYVRAKKEGKTDLRLLFVTYKDQKAYVVTPLQFTLRREAGRGLKYRYDLQLKAWRVFPSREIIIDGAGRDLFVSTGFSIQNAVEILDQGRQTIAGAVSIVRNARGAVTRLTDIMRESSLAMKEAMGAVVSLIDLPYQIIADCKGSFIESWDNLKDGYSDLKSAYTQAMEDLGVKKPRGAPRFVDEYFSHPDSAEASLFLSRADISKINMPVTLQNKIQAEIERVTNLTGEDYARRRDEVERLAVQISDSVGASDATFDSTYSNLHATVTRTPSQGDWDVLFAINDTLRSLNALSLRQTVPPTTMEYVAGFATKSGTAFHVPVSKYAVPFPYDYTLEELARKYLGDPDRWIEIATLNGLRAPYVDEVGFTYPLLGNGSLSEIIVSTDTNLAIGQAVWIESKNAKREKRHILNIRVIGPGNVVLTLDGIGDLAKYTVGDDAFMHAFLPDTVNSLQLIYIPSNEPASENEQLARVPGVDAFDDLLDVGGVDLLLTSDNDLAITEDGDCRMAFGMQNLIQRARIALSTPRGVLIRHPNFGLPVKAGMSVADLDINELKSAVTDIFKEDPSFDGATSVSILQSGSTLQIGIGLAVTGQDHPLSLAFQVRR